VLDTAEKSHPLIRIPAVLSGPDGIVTRCFVETWTEQSSTGKTCTRCRITDDPPELPDGDYMVEFAEQSVRTKRHHGKWQLVFLCPDLEMTDAA
jgi:hypothetical protein